MSNSNIEKYFFTVIESVDLLHKNTFMGQMLTIIYSSIDTFGLLDAPENVKKSSGKTFQDWVDKYLLKDSSLACSAKDLWGARCGVLHTHTTESDLSKKEVNPVKEIQYISGPSDHPMVKAFIEAAPDIGNSIGINIDILVIDFLKAINRFNTDFVKKLSSSDACQTRTNKILTHFSL